MSPPDGYSPHCLKLEEWPRACREGWEEAIKTPGLFEEARPGSKWRAATEVKIRKGFGVYLHWLKAHGLLLAWGDPARLVTLERAKAYQAALLAIGCAPLTIYNRLQELHFAVRVLAPGLNLAWLAQAVKRLRKTARPIRYKLARLQRADRLKGLGLDLMTQADSDDDRTMYKRALMFRDGLMIALLAHRPLRLKNFGSLAIGSSLILDGENGVLVFPGSEMKGKRPLEVPFPASLRGRLQTYLDVYRPNLLTMQRVPTVQPVDALWISNEGRRMDDGSIRAAIKKRTRAAFGQDLSPHLFRDCAVTTVVRDAPASARLTRDLLGHASIDVTNNHYNQALMIEASRRHTASMESMLEQYGTTRAAACQGTSTCAR